MYITLDIIPQRDYDELTNVYLHIVMAATIDAIAFMLC